jgi:DNA polymerase-3 subunit beta
MKIQFNRSALTEALGLITSVVPHRTPKPVLKCVKIDAQEQEVHLSATDLEIGLDYTISEVKVDQIGQAVLDADRLASIVRESTDEVLTLEMKDSTCEIKGADSSFIIYSQDPEQFPAVPTFSGDADILVNLELLKAGTRRCLFATAKESSRYAINGVLWETKGKKLVLVATDGRRLARTKVSLSKAGSEAAEAQSIIVPAKTMTLLERIGADEKDDVAIKLAGNHLLISCAHVVINSNLVEGSFPKYDDIIPKDFDKKIMLNCDAVASAVRRASLLASEESKGIKLSFSKNSLLFSGRAPEAGMAEIKMAIEYDAEPISIGFNPQFLIDVIKVIPGSEFEMDLGQADRPGLIKSGSDLLYVLMPINLA